MLTLKCNSHPSRLSMCEKKLRSPALLPDLETGAAGFVLLCCALKRLPAFQWVEWQFTPALCYPLLRYTQTPVHAIHTPDISRLTLITK